MASIERSARVPFSAEQMLALVNDIDAYPDFLHWCHAARIESQRGNSVDAAMDIGLAGIYRRIRTRNTTEHGEHRSSIRIEMIDGPLKKLEGAWTFTDRSDCGSDVVLKLDYEVPFSPFGRLLKTLFDDIANSQLKAFVKRAREVYGSE